MNRITLGAGALLLASTSLASAGALDRTGQPIGILFEEGNHAELSYGFTRPEVQGVFPPNGAQSGDVGADFSQAALSFKYDLGERLSAAVIVEQPFGADVDYGGADPAYPIAGSIAEFDTTSITALGRFELNESFSLHAGARLVRVDADLLSNALIPVAPGVAQLYSYDGDFDSDSDLGFVVGAAYERPDIALRVALTYSSETDFSHDTSFATTLGGAPLAAGTGLTEFTLPRSVNLDVQTGIAPDTLLFGSIRWADWSATEIRVPGYGLAPLDPTTDFNPVVSYGEDVITYTLGLGRRLTDRLSASASVIYEPQAQSDFDPAVEGSGVSNLAPTNGQIGIQLAASYALTDSVELGAGIRYTRLGDATTRRIGAVFEDNDALSLGLRVGYRF